MFPLQPIFPSPPEAEMSGRGDFFLWREKQELSPGAGGVPLKPPHCHQRLVSLKGCISPFLLHGPLVRHAAEPSCPLQSAATTKES